ncbi:hypothetical protein CCR92_02765, partial [Rhodospirillum rubrum]|nr:hypothetical protein [Rhodospirillum rubrum]
MSSAVPPSLPPTPPVVPPPAPTTAVVTAPPAAVVALPPGSQIDAVVQALAGRGEVTLSSSFGELTLKTPLDLPAGSTLSLTLIGQNRGQTLVRISALNGRPPLAGLSGGAAGAANPTAGALPGSLGGVTGGPINGAGLRPGGMLAGLVAGGDRVSLGSAGAGPAGGGLSALLVRGPADGAPPTGLGGLEIGSRLTVRLVSVGPPAGGLTGPGGASPGAFPT